MTSTVGLINSTISSVGLYAIGASSMVSSYAIYFSVQTFQQEYYNHPILHNYVSNLG